MIVVMIVEAVMMIDVMDVVEVSTPIKEDPGRVVGIDER